MYDACPFVYQGHNKLMEKAKGKHEFLGNSEIFGFMVHNHPLEYYFDYAIKYKFNHLEIDLNKKHSLVQTFTPERINRISQYCQEKDISLSLHPPHNINLCAPNLVTRHRNVMFLKKCIHLASQLNAQYITLHMGSFHRTAAWSEPRQNALERLCRVLKKILPLCEKKGIQLALENVVPLPREAGFAFLGDNITDFQFIFSQQDSEFIKFCLDIGHANIKGNPLQYIEKLGKEIVGIHFHDNRGQKDEHLIVGDGTVPWEDLMIGLKGINFRGPFISECFKSLPHQAKQKLKKYMTDVS